MSDDIPFERDDMRLDVRVAPHAIRRGQLTWEELEGHLGAIPDEAEEGVEVEVKFTPTFAQRADQPEASDD